MEMSGQLHSPAAIPLGKEPPITHWIGGVGPWTGLDAVEKRKMSSLAVNRTSAVHLIARLYTN
jgi:hypothetical protein